MAEQQGSNSKEKKVMVAMDGSESSKYALVWALDNLAGSISSSSFFIFTAQPVVDLGYLYAASLGSAPPELVENVQQQQQKYSAALLEDAKAICVNRGVSPKTVTEVGDPKEAICDAVEKLSIDLLVVGSQGKGALKRVVLGSVSNYCVHNAKCPVLVVKKPA